MLRKIVGGVAAFYFAIFSFATWHYIATNNYTWKNVLAASITTIMCGLGVWLVFSKDEEPNEEAS